MIQYSHRGSGRGTQGSRPPAHSRAAPPVSVVLSREAHLISEERINVKNSLPGAAHVAPTKKIPIPGYDQQLCTAEMSWPQGPDVGVAIVTPPASLEQSNWRIGPTHSVTDWTHLSLCVL